MKKLTSVMILITITICSNAQNRAVMRNDTLYYQGMAYWVGKPIRLGYGSGPSKSFSFAWTGTGLTGMQTMPSTYSKSDAIIEKIYTQRKKYYLKAKPTEQVLLDKFFIEIEGAVDNNELIE